MPATIIKVSNAAQLAAAIKSIKGGETILLAAGDYGAVSIVSRMLTSTVTIKSADPANDARISDLRIHQSSGFRIEDIDLNRPLKAGEADFTQAAYISSSNNIQLVGMDFRGSMDGNAKNDGVALRVTGSTGVSVTGSTFEQWSTAAWFADSKAMTVSGNTVTGVVKTFTFSGMSGTTVADNSFVGVKTGWAPAVDGVSFRNNVVSGIAEPASGKGVTIAVANAAQLATAVAGAKGGETILLAGGSYGDLTIKNKAFADALTIKSADGANDAVFTSIRVHAASGVVFDDIDVRRTLLAGEGDWTQSVYVSDSSRIDFVRTDFAGSLDGNTWNDGHGLRVDQSKDVRVVDSTFEQLKVAASFSNSSGIAVVGNSVTDVREGFDFAAVQKVTIAQNRLTGFDPNYAAGDHSDAIQFWNAGVNKGSSQVVIRDNVILQGANGGTQGIFIGSEVATARHSDFVIENNLYNGDARHGISIYAVDGAVIRGNTVTSAPNGYLEAGININGSAGVLVENNITPLLLQDKFNSGVTLRGNVDLWDRNYKTGLTLAQVFDTPAGGLFAESSYVAKGASGFHGFDGIGASSFDLQSFKGSAEVGALLQTLHIA
ncbi:right-handed parallel beta-helix repeat-containing protein [Glacieibacterium frigidum]|uniref:Right handed beta helix domain-containing protein n=1 Tax=Glacieibacterium frigidum TaxID=2593303 RepID=A0A552UAJ6_9SPHN|nr:right-handed parallel beta-helix repeat-containing protein [Glacieibacterium frigidum]TRW15234.1 hypothetical protein FMM06_16535 [Glacieibacterium frigidum]